MRCARMWLILLMVMTGFIVSGCDRAEKTSNGKDVIAKINSYTMTVEDLLDAAPRAMGRTKEEILDELITKNVLIQEAQKENFDKDKAFMKEIERYWEQALLKLVIKKKMAEFAGTIDDGEKIDEVMEKWVRDLKARSNIKIYKENLEEVKIP